MSHFKGTLPHPNPPVPAHKFAGPYTSPLLLSLPGSTDLQSRYAHLNCSFVSPELRPGCKATCSDKETEPEQTWPVAPTLVDLKRHVQSLCNLIVDLTAWEGPIDACYNPQHNDKNAFDWLDSLRSNTPYATYPPSDTNANANLDARGAIESWQSTPLTSVLNRHWEPPALSAEEKKKRMGKHRDQLPPIPMPCPLAPDYKGPDDIGTIVAHANAIFEELEERLVDRGGILALYPVSSEEGVGEETDEEEEKEGEVKMGGVDDRSGGGIRPPNLKFKRPTTSRSALEASRSTIFGQYLSYTSALAHRVTTLEAELEAARRALAGEACVPHVLANGVIPPPTTTRDANASSKTQERSSTAAETSSRPVFRPLLSSQDRYVLANLSPELDARISARLSHDSRVRRAAEREAHGKIRPGRLRRDYAPSPQKHQPEPDRQYRENGNDNEGGRAGPSQVSPPPPPPASPATPTTASGFAREKLSTKRRRGVEDDEEEGEEVEEESLSPIISASPFPDSDSEGGDEEEDEEDDDDVDDEEISSIPSTPNSIIDTFRDMDVDDTLLPSAEHKPLSPISYVDIPARAYRIHDATKTIFIVLGVGMGPDVKVGGGRTDGNEKGVRGMVGREELIGRFRKWKNCKGKGKEKMVMDMGAAEAGASVSNG